MRLRSLGLGLILMIMPALVAAEVYRYIDENGVIHFTDNYIKIPENQRPKVDIITRPDETASSGVKMEMGRTEETRPPAELAEGNRSNEEADAQVPEAVAEGAQSQQQFDALIKAKANLDKIYSVLTAEKEVLEKEQKTLKTVESIRVYQNKINLFNQRLVDYERQRQSFQTRADTYNKAVAK